MTSATAPAGTGPAELPLRANRDFRLLWIGQALSDFGSAMTALVIPLALLRGGHSTSAAGAVGTAILLTAMVARMPAGYATDRFGQRRLMLGADLGRMVVLCALAAWTFWGRLPVALAVLGAAAAQLGVEVFRPSQNAALRRIVPAGQLGTAISVNQARAYAADIAAPAAAGLLIAVSLSIPLAFDALTFAVSALCVGLLSATAFRKATRKGPAEQAQPRERFLPRLTAGLRYVVSQRFLRALAVLAAGQNFVFQALSYALILGMGREQGGGAVGAAMSAAAVTGLAGSLIAPQLQRRLRAQVVVAAGPAVAGVLLATAWVTGSEVAFAAAFSALCLLTPVNGAVFGTLLATSVPEEIYGRTTAALGFVAEILQPLGPLVAGLLLVALSLSGIAALFALAFAALAGLALLLPSPSASVRS